MKIISSLNMMKLLLLALVLFLTIVSCDEETKTISKAEPPLKNTIDSTITKKVEKEISQTIKKAKLITKDNVLEIFQPFQGDSLISDSIHAKLANTTGAMLSAYSLDNSKYKTSYRTNNGKGWSHWKQFHLNHHVNNPNRKVYEAVSINNDIVLLQFKNSSTTKSDVVFRLYKFPNN